MNLLSKNKLKIRVSDLRNKQAIISIGLNIILLVFMVNPLLNPQRAEASVTEAFVRFDRLSNGATISGTACEKTGTTGTETNVVILFPGTWTISQTTSNWTVSVTNLPTDPIGGGAATAWPNIAAANGTGGAVSGQSVTFGTTGSGDLTPGTFYCFNFTGASSTMATGDNQAGTLKTKGGSPFVDTTDWAISVVTANADQITVTASVSATMSFSLSANSVALGTLSTGSVASGSITQTVSTNARNGYISWIKGTNWNGLYSPTANAMIFSAGTYPQIADFSIQLQRGYGLDAQPGTNTPVISAGYQGTATTVGHIDSAQFRQVSSLTGPQSGTTVTLNIRSQITATQSAASDYADTLTVVAAGSF